MIEMQLDVVDVVARRVTPKLVQICQTDAKGLIPSQSQADLDKMLGILSDWPGSFDMDSVAATLYTRWYIQFIRNLYLRYGFTEEDRMAFSDNYHFTDAFQNIIESILVEKEKSHFQIICEGSYPDNAPKGLSNHCAYQIAMALLDAKEFLERNVSADVKDWAWGRNHVMDYTNLPFSKTILKPLFHRSVPVPGNSNTPFFAKISERKNRDEGLITSTAAGGLKMVI